MTVTPFQSPTWEWSIQGLVVARVASCICCPELAIKLLPKLLGKRVSQQMWALGNYIQGRAYCMGWLLQSCGSILPFLLGWSAWGRPHEIGRAGECLGIFGKSPVAPMLEESNLWCCATLVPHLCTFDLKSGGIQRKVTETWWELAEKMVAPCPNLRLTTGKSAWQLHHWTRFATMITSSTSQNLHRPVLLGKLSWLTCFGVEVLAF